MILFRGDKLAKVVFGVTVGAYFFYLCYSFRGLEERYTLPILPIMLLALFNNIYVLSKRSRSKVIIH